jgi:SAM-dependent methyltransferase
MFGSELSLLPGFSPLERQFVRRYGTLSAPTVRRYLRFKYFASELDQQGVRFDKILDYGCAFGGFGFALARENRRALIYLYEPDSDASRKCQLIAEHGPYPNVRVVDRSALDRERDFSLVLLIHVLEHVEDDLGLLTEIHRLLAPGGHLYLDVPPAHHEHKRSLDDYVGHVRSGYEPAEIADRVARTGFQIVAQPRFAVRKLGRVTAWCARQYARLTRSPDHPLLDFTSLPRLSTRRKAALAGLWPFYRTLMELEAWRRNRTGSIVLLARKQSS